MDDEWEEDRLSGRLAEPFLLTEPLPAPTDAPADELTRGTLMLAEEGCGIYIRLILNGPRAGEVWVHEFDGILRAVSVQHLSGHACQDGGPERRVVAGVSRALRRHVVAVGLLLET
ncbi:hypothetical protein [Streptomyces sp. P17]|uniref:hypothetical protein n=1 Tax=Streptomyces sp. P17 TaxID=3074716 RepID=UPI0028F3EE6B|nr:hypothetical protein [Streptomyces sp. P17]MDT9700962.1 hypothetical protein [Streptomyces sp. P17]